MYAVGINGLVNKFRTPATGWAVSETVFTAEKTDFSPLKVFGLSGGGDGTLNINKRDRQLVQASNPVTKETESRGSQVQA